MNFLGELTAEQKQLICLLIGLFETEYIGAEHAVNMVDLQNRLALMGKPMHNRLIRRLIGHIRENDLANPGFLVSNVKTGYWLSHDKTEQNEFLDEQLDRMGSQFKNIKSLHQRLRYAKDDSKNQQPKLF